ncbi:MAG: penicillin-binding protein 2 [Alphaproteobacteria bacterium]|jgi:penicillin-binding protein 2|nr:penicillin-binding protein 2 [Alphaproteobacteria bacterium]
MVDKSGGHSRIKQVTRRAFVLGGVQAALIAGLAGRLYQLQVVEGERYRVLADDNRISFQLLPPPRGRIFDRFGQPLAANRQNYRLILVPEQAGDLEPALQALAALVPMGEQERARILREAGRKRSFVPITVRENLSWREVSRIEVSAPDLPGVIIEVGENRHYDYGAKAAHLIGYVGAVSENELQEGDPVLSLPGFRVGKTGVERIFESGLRGKAGSRQVEVNAVGRIIRELERDEGQPGDDHVLSVDMGLQDYAMARMGEESAAAAVLDVHTGEVLTLASTPAYDPNSFTTGISSTEWKSLIEHPRFPLTNKVISGQYPPGSTFKMIVALAALESGELTPQNSFFCPGHLTLGDTKFHCWRRGGHGRVDMELALEKSCDVYFYEAAKRVGIERIGEMARRFGFGSPVGIELPGEKGGLVPSNEWKKKQHGVSWQLGETLIVGIGQGFMLATPMQLAVMAARIANGGIAVRPTLVRSIYRDGTPVPRPRDAAPTMNISPAHLAVVQNGMRRVVNSPGGTAFRARIDEPEFAMAGKTGSAQVRRISKREREEGVRKNQDRIWKYRDHALFVGYAPLEAPRYAAAVVVEHGGGGSTVAAPIVRDILHEAQRRDPIGRTPAQQVTASRIGGPASVPSDAPLLDLRRKIS